MYDLNEVKAALETLFWNSRFKNAGDLKTVFWSFVPAGEEHELCPHESAAYVLINEELSGTESAYDFRMAVADLIHEINSLNESRFHWAYSVTPSRIV